MIKEINTHRLWEISRLIYREEDDTGIFNYPYDLYDLTKKKANMFEPLDEFG